MADQISNVCVNLGQKLDCLSLRSSDSLIFKVPDQLLRINEKAYEPQMISIGPYHRGKQNLKAMEKHKLHYLKTLLQRRNENLVSYVEAMQAMENEARKCYERTVDDVSPEAFVEMMILDGCFIVELIWRWEKALTEGNDELFTVNSIRVGITHDLLLLENQLPFFVLLKLFAMSYTNAISNHQNPDSYFIRMALVFFAPKVLGPGIQYKYGTVQDIRHLLDLVHKCWLPSPPGMQRYREKRKRGENLIIEIIRSASELREAGVKFEKITVKGDSLFDIRFENGRIMIPVLRVDNDTERFFRNLMTYEQFMINRPTYVTDYVLFMDSLINSGKDVEILCRRGIMIKNWLGDDEVVNMFKRLKNSILSYDNFYYAKVFDDINFYSHYWPNTWKGKWDIWKAILMQNYFNTPWTIISFLAAFVALLLTLVQTIYSVLSYSYSK